MKKAIVCGTRFGQFYIEALKNIQDIELIGILANGSERSIKCAKYYKLKLFTDIESLPNDIDFACIAIGSSVFGGNGIYIAKELLKKGINVIFEQPIHSKEISELYNMSILTNEKFNIGNLYNNLPAVKSFLLNANIASEIEQPSYIMIDLNTQLSYPVSGIIKKILKDTIEVKENYKYIEGESCCNILSINIGKTEIIIKAFNEMGSENLDTDMRMLFSMSVGYSSGRLILSSPLGPVLWEQSPNVPKVDIIPRFLESNDDEGCSKPWMSILYEGDTYNKSYVYRNLWVEAITDDLKEFIFSDTSKKQINSIKIQNELETSMLWQKVMSSLGYPKQKSLCSTKYIDPDKFKKNEVLHYNIKESINELNKVCRDTMFYHLSKYISEHGISILSLLETLSFKDKYKKIIVRWINHLLDFEYLEKNNGYIFTKREKIAEIDLLKKWDILESKWNEEAMPMNVFQYFRNNAKLLSDLLKNDINANEILFVEGSDIVAKALYSKTAIAKYLNELMVSKIKELNKNKDLTILELGGGTAATTEKIVNSIAYEKYIFTDISPYFIENAKNNFIEYKNIEYKIIDIDNCISYKQIKNKVDLIIAVGVLNNAKNIEKTLSYIKELLKDDGFLMIVEAVDESPEILISQVFMMSEPDDVRMEENITFLKMEQWKKIFKNQKLELILFEPEYGNYLENFKQKLFILKKMGGKNHGNRE